ncbi:hypothetical protein OG470_05910 [Micromonospora sp. NBC_00389]|uniref:hypothetical protein n=1 Tax=Micromonospora sp. NBC_00389 TaxID=2903586 RepID=UPI002E22A030
MNRTALRRTRGRLVSLPRVLLLVLLALGVAGMHTFGHGDGGHQAASGHGIVVGSVPHGTLSDPGQDGSHEQHLIARIGEPTPAGGMDLDVFSVCLAVLGALGLIVWVALLRATSLNDRPVPRTRPTIRSGGRGPSVPLLGLHVATVSVLRI